MLSSHFPHGIWEVGSGAETRIPIFKISYSDPTYQRNSLLRLARRDRSVVVEAAATKINGSMGSWTWGRNGIGGDSLHFWFGFYFSNILWLSLYFLNKHPSCYQSPYKHSLEVTNSYSMWEAITEACPISSSFFKRNQSLKYLRDEKRRTKACNFETSIFMPSHGLVPSTVPIKWNDTVGQWQSCHRNWLSRYLIGFKYYDVRWLGNF